jgi:hypothetical protein
MILQECVPGLRRRFAAVHYVFTHAALTNADAEFEQFAVDARCTPAGILPTHLADQLSDLARNERSSGLAAPCLPGPEQTKAGTMPGYDRLWLDDGQRRAPVTPEAGQTDLQGDPLKSISGAFLRTSEARRFGGAEPDSRAQGQHASGRLKTELRGVS